MKPQFHPIFKNDRTFKGYSESKFREGVMAYWDGLDYTENPYRNSIDTETECYYVSDMYWFKGWKSQDNENELYKTALSRYRELYKTWKWPPILATHNNQENIAARFWVESRCF